MKKKIAIALSLVLVIACGFIINGMTSKANSANIAITVDEAEIKKGQEFIAKVTIDSDVAMASVDSFVSYDPELLEYLPSEEDAVAGASGIIHIMEDFEEGKQTIEYELTFKALEVGTVDIDLYDTLIEEFENLNFLEAATTKATVTVIEDTAQSGEARLSDLLVAPGELDKEFDPNTFEYSVDVTEDDDMVALSAIPMEEAAVVTVEQDEVLSMGANTIKINVTSPSGHESTYTLTVNRGALPVEETPDTQTEEGTEDTLESDDRIESDDTLENGSEAGIQSIIP